MTPNSASPADLLRSAMTHPGVVSTHSAVSQRQPRQPAPRRPRSARMKAAIYARVSTLDQEPENQLQELRRYAEARGLDGGRVRRSWRERREGSSARARSAAGRCQAPAVRCPGVLAARSTRTQPQASDHVARRLAGARRGVREPRRRDRRHDARRQAADAHPRRDRRVRASADRRARTRGLARRAAQGKPLGRPRQTISEGDLARTIGLSTRKAAALLGVSHAAIHRARTVSKTPQPSLTDCA